VPEEKRYIVVNGISYDERTPAAVIRTLEDARNKHCRLRLHYGDTDTGRDWGETNDVTGYIRNSMGPLKIPILVHNARSMGGGAILDHCIVKITTTQSPRRTLYQHPHYTPPPS
jgi:hypothetical protein